MNKYLKNILVNIIREQKYFFLFFGINIIFNYSCRTAKVPEGKALLTKVQFKVKGDKSDKSSILNYVKQKPNEKFLSLFPVGLYINSFTNIKYDTFFDEYQKIPLFERNQKTRDSLYERYNLPQAKGKSKSFSRWVYGLGAKPIIVDKELVDYSVKNIENYYKIKGFWDVKASAEIKNNAALFGKEKKQKVIYSIETGTVSKIADIKYDIQDDNIRNIYEKNLRETLIKKGNNLDGYVFDKEYARLEKIIRNQGYFNFNSNKDEMLYEGDSMVDRKNIPINLVIKKSKLGMLDTTKVVFRQSRYNNVVLAYGKNISNIDKSNCIYDSINKLYIYNPQNEYKNSVFSNAVLIKKGNLYTENDFINTNRNINTLNNFIIEEIRPKSINDSLLDINISLKPRKKYDFDFSLDGFLGSGNYGIIPGTKLSVRNVFGGAENFEIGINGTIGTITNSNENDNFFGSYELSAFTNLNIPRWWLPFKLGRKIPSRYLPSTVFSLKYSLQKNIGLDKTNLAFQLNYNLQPNTIISHKFSLLNLQYTNVLKPSNYFNSRIDETTSLIQFLEEYQIYNPSYVLTGDENLNLVLTDIYTNDTAFISYLAATNPDFERTMSGIYLNFKRATDNTLLDSFIYEYNYNELRDKEQTNPINFIAKVELGGNIFSTLEKFIPTETETILGKETTKIAGISYAQFLKLDFEIRKNWVINGVNKIVSRAYFGVGVPFGNSLYLPFDRRYYMGGANDLRAWRPPNIEKGLGLGPGDKQENLSNRGFGNMKLLFNIEWRYPISKGFEGAIFTDAGNVWETDSNFENTFELKNFYQQLAIGSGLGFRYNISYFVLRLDFAYKMYDPSLSLHNRWIGNKINILQPTIQFALGFPF